MFSLFLAVAMLLSGMQGVQGADKHKNMGGGGGGTVKVKNT